MLQSDSRRMADSPKPARQAQAKQDIVVDADQDAAVNGNGRAHALRGKAKNDRAGSDGDNVRKHDSAAASADHSAFERSPESSKGSQDTGDAAELQVQHGAETHAGAPDVGSVSVKSETDAQVDGELGPEFLDHMPESVEAGVALTGAGGWYSGE